MEWIDVNIKMPLPKQLCLTYTSLGYFQVRMMNQHKFSEQKGHKVTHWLPLPEAPKKDDEK